jgi:uncharacterized protein
MSSDEESQRHLIQHKLDKADSTVDDIRFLLDNDKLAIAINRIYYAVFYALSALALKRQFSTAKHQQLIGWFNREFIKEHVVDRRYGEILHRAFDKRSKGDYDDFVEFSKEEVEQMLLDTILFVEKIKELIFTS